MLSIFSCAYWPFVYLLWMNAYSSPFPILKTDVHCFFIALILLWITIMIYSITLPHFWKLWFRKVGWLLGNRHKDTGPYLHILCSPGWVSSTFRPTTNPLICISGNRQECYLKQILELDMRWSIKVFIASSENPHEVAF